MSCYGIKSVGKNIASRTQIQKNVP